MKDRKIFVRFVFCLILISLVQGSAIFLIEINHLFIGFGVWFLGWMFLGYKFMDWKRLLKDLRK